MNRLAWLLFCFALGCSPTPPPPAPAPAASTTPITTATSDYRFLEKVDDPATAAWVAKRHAAARAALDSLPSRPFFHERIGKYIQLSELSRPWRTRTGLLYYLRKVPGKGRRLLVRSRVFGDEKSEEVVLDPNGWSKDGRKDLTGWVISHDERLMAYGESDGGSDWRTWRVLDLQTLKPRPDELRGIKWDRPSFTPDDAALLYTGYENRSHDETASGTDSRIYAHRIGTAQKDDPVVYRPENPEWIARADVEETGAYVVVATYKSSDGRNRLQIFPWPGKRTPADVASIFAGDAPHVLSPAFGYRQWDVALERDAIYLFSEREAPTGRVDRYVLASGELETVIPPQKETLTDVGRAGPYLFATYIADLDTRVRVFDLKGQPVDAIRMPTPSRLAGFGGASWSTHTYFSSEGYDRPYGVIEYDLSQRKQKPIWSLDVEGFSPEKTTAKQVFYPSKDGTKIPMFVVHDADLKRDGRHPTLLIGYGCYGYVLPIHFATARVPWLQKGGVIAVANIRGGGAYGEKWHLAGKKENKQTSIDDFVAAATYLQQEGYTSPEHTSILGGSCGGLLVGATLTERPELFGAAVAEVGVLDLLNYHRFSGAYLWKDELGSPEVPEERAYLEKLSPVRRAQRRQAYPATLITTRKKDTRVSPMNSYKFAAVLADHQDGDAPVLLRVDEIGGHSSQSLPLEMRIDYLADVYAFAWDMTQAK